LADADRAGRLRLDSLLRHTQDVSDDDTTDAGLGDEPSWVARRHVIDVLRPAGLFEELRITTFCGGLGRRWAERRLTITGSAGAAYEVSTLWICVDPESGRPVPLNQRFLDRYQEASGDRRIGARLTVPGPGAPAGAARSGESAGGLEIVEDRAVAWPIREVDLDLYGHVNNAAYGAALEELRPHLPTLPPCRWTIEYRTGIEAGAEITLRWRRLGDRALVWWMPGRSGSASASASTRASAGSVAGGASGGERDRDGNESGDGLEAVASASVEPLPDGFYREPGSATGAVAAGGASGGADGSMLPDRNSAAR
jgi:acyl-ACP thioesterase